MSDDRVLVFFDLETTGLDTAVCDLIQVAAVCGQEVFNVFTLPRQALTESATRVTGFTVRGDELFRNGLRVSTTPLDEALSSFISFLRSFQRPVLLAAHNAKRFDKPVLTRVLKQRGLLQQFQAVVCGYLDTFLLSKNLYPGLQGHSQEFMVRHFLGVTYDAHNAMEDSRMLQMLFRYWKPTRRSQNICTLSTNQWF